MEDPFAGNPLWLSFWQSIFIYAAVVLGLFAIGIFVGRESVVGSTKKKRALKRIDLISYWVSVIGFTGLLGPLYLYTNDVSELRQRYDTVKSSLEPVKSDFFALNEICSDPKVGDVNRKECLFIRTRVLADRDDTIYFGTPVKEIDELPNEMSSDNKSKIERINVQIRDLNDRLRNIKIRNADSAWASRFVTLAWSLFISSLLSFGFGLGVFRRTYEFINEAN